ncbi:hypothetical protein [Agrococcus beijingensis]|uniref:hypothetical protein n=1 Tax=Agrococcus beijingensis TaxID=3068634 RepID=UPI0027418BA6|nr:hypothetical protein [Agrococcus sp. REN33]
MPLKREVRAKEQSGSSEATLEHVAETLAQIVDDDAASRDVLRLTAARKLGELDRLYLAALRRRAAGELMPRDPGDAAPLQGRRLITLTELLEAIVRLMSDDEADRERRRLRAAAELNQSDSLYLAALRGRHSRRKHLRKEAHRDH